MTTRRDFLKISGLGAGALVLPSGLFAEPIRGTPPKRFIFIRKSSGIRPAEIALPDFSDKDKALDEKKMSSSEDNSDRKDHDEIENNNHQDEDNHKDEDQDLDDARDLDDAPGFDPV